jgi:hypothetical protein
MLPSGLWTAWLTVEAGVNRLADMDAGCFGGDEAYEAGPLLWYASKY